MRAWTSSATVGYVSNLSARAEYKRRIQQRQTVIFGSIAAVMSFLLVLAMLTWTGVLPFPFNREFSAKPDPNTVVTPCLPAGAAALDLSAISANVYNSTSRTGIAGEAAGKLQSLGVAVASTGNWSGQSLAESARIQTGTQGVTAAYTLAQYIPGAVIQYNPELNGETLNVILGSEWNDFATAESVSAANPQGTLTSAAQCTTLDDSAGQ